MIVRAQIVRVVAVEQVLPQDAKGSDNWRWRRRYHARRLYRFRLCLGALREADGRHEQNTERREQLDSSHFGTFRPLAAAI